MLSVNPPTERSNLAQQRRDKEVKTKRQLTYVFVRTVLVVSLPATMSSRASSCQERFDPGAPTSPSSSDLMSQETTSLGSWSCKLFALSCLYAYIARESEQEEAF